MVRLLENARYEVLPTASIEDVVLEHLGTDLELTITASPSKGLEATLDLAERLTGHGYTTVPHLAARMVRDRAELSEICDRLTGKGITKVFVPAGDADPPGGYPDSLSMLEDLADLGRPFAHVGITGYPESHPTISDDLTIQSMWDKRRYATHVVSNLTFDPDMLATWVAPDAEPRHHHAPAAGRPRPGRPDQAARDGHQDRRRRVHPVPGQAQGHLRPARRTRRLHRRAVPGEGARRRCRRPRCWSRGCTSSRSTRWPPPRSGAAGCSSGSPPRSDRARN